MQDAPSWESGDGAHHGRRTRPRAGSALARHGSGNRIADIPALTQHGPAPSPALPGDSPACAGTPGAGTGPACWGRVLGGSRGGSTPRKGGFPAPVPALCSSAMSRLHGEGGSLGSPWYPVFCHWHPSSSGGSAWPASIVPPWPVAVVFPAHTSFLAIYSHHCRDDVLWVTELQPRWG